MSIIKKHTKPPYIVDHTALKQFDERKNIWGRLSLDRDASFYKRSMYDRADEVLARNYHGYSRIEYARMLASWTVYDYFRGAFSWEKLTDANSVMAKPEFGQFSVENRTMMSAEVKNTALAFGASLVGICHRDNRWIYSHNLYGNIITIPDEFEYVIVMAIAMNPEDILASPAFVSCTATGIGYSMMAFCIACLSEFIRYLGYKAIPMGNDTALSIPLAVDAGLGELGRNGLLITPAYGPCIRLCKIFTTLPLEIDKPITFGVLEFCRGCFRCAEACKPQAIQKDTEPSFKIVSPSNNQGICRWAVNHDLCYSFWIDNGCDCSNCIAVCPFFQSKQSPHQ